MTPAKRTVCIFSGGEELAEGSIARGKVADFFLVDGDPLADLSQLRKVTTVVRGGTLHDSAELYRSVGVRP